MRKAINIPKEYLEHAYMRLRKSAVTIAKEIGCGKTTVFRYLQTFAIPTRSTTDVLREIKWSDTRRRKLSESMKGINTWMKGRTLSAETRQKISQRLKGRKLTQSHCKATSAGRKGMKLSPEHRANMSSAMRGKYSGSKHWNWQGGKTSNVAKIRHSAEYKEWRLRIFERDKFACVFCGDKKGGNLHAHHLLFVSEWPNKIYDLDNAITLCKPCHMKLHGELSCAKAPEGGSPLEQMTGAAK